MHRPSHPQLDALRQLLRPQDRGKDLRPIYTAANAEEAEQPLVVFDKRWGGQYPMIAQAWRANWEYVIPFLSLPGALRKAVYTTNTIEALHRQIRKAIKTRGHFPTNKPRPS